jgi:hypothetical protein
MAIGNERKIRELQDDDIDWIGARLRELRIFLELKSGERLKDIPDPAFLDKYFEIAVAEMREGLIPQETLIHMFGAGFGQYFEEKTDYKWVVYSDEYGTDLALRHEKTGALGFPISSTSKRLSDETAGTFVSIYDVLTASN